MMLTSRIFGAIVVCALAVAPRVQATEVLNTTYSAWLGTVSSSSEWNFSFPQSTYNSAAGYSLNLANASYGTTNVTGPDGSGYYLQKNSYGSSNLQSLESAADGVGSMVFNTPGSGVTAFLLGLGIVGNNSPITVTLSDGETFSVSLAPGGNAYLGLSSATQITSFTLSTLSGSQINVSDFFAGITNEPASTANAPTAEVATALMIGSGLFLFGARRKIFSNLSHSKTQAA